MRKYLIGTIAALVGALALSSVASADVTGVSVAGTTITPAKQNKKVRGPVSAFVNSDDAFAGALPCPLGTANSQSCYAFPPSTQSLVIFPKDLKIDPGNLPDCQLSRIVGQSAASARAACAGSIVGGGGEVQTFSDGRRLSGTLTAFNGAPSGGNPTMYIHADLPGVGSKPILNGPIVGNTVRLQIPPVQGSVIDDFNISIFKKVVGKNKKTGKKTYYLSARCSTGKWNTTEVVTYQDGSTESDTAAGKCKQKK
jgi:hypothetical protein